MIHRMLRYPSGWEWHVLQLNKQLSLRQEPLPSRKESQKQSVPSTDGQQANTPASRKELEAAWAQNAELKRNFPECAAWIDDCSGRETNHIFVGEAVESGPLICGTLMLQVSEELTDVQAFHFWLTKKKLLTMHDDFRLPLRLQTEENQAKLAECETAPEAFFVMLGTILETFHDGLDGFETRLGELESTMRVKNRTGLLEEIFERRYDLLHWNHLFIPVRELQGAAKEAFMEELTETEGFRRISHKLERIDELLKHYAVEIDTLISMNDAISSFRGNDIMKTLTIFTVLFLPASVIGALWGVNFTLLPWKDEEWGFTGMMSVISIITIIIYIWLWRKGWTGDLLHGRKPQELTPQTSRDHSRSSKNRKQQRKAPQAAAASELHQQEAAETALSPRKRR
ncbi:Magnesium transport protein CorA [compost metagenome]